MIGQFLKAYYCRPGLKEIDEVGEN